MRQYVAIFPTERRYISIYLILLKINLINRIEQTHCREETQPMELATLAKAKTKALGLPIHVAEAATSR